MRRPRRSSLRFNLHRLPARRQSGVTLIELMVAMFILLGALIPLSKLLLDSIRTTTDVAALAKANELCKGMMDEIASKKWDESADSAGHTDTASATIALDAGENQSNRFILDDMDDFNGLVELPGNLRNASGDVMPNDYQRYTRRAVVKWATEVQVAGSPPQVSFSTYTPPLPGTPVTGPTNFKWVQITVSWIVPVNTQKQTQMSTMYSNYARK